MNLPRLLPSLALPALSLLLGGCVLFKPPPPPQIIERRVEVMVPVVEPADLAARQLLAYHERLRQLPPAELALEVTPGDDAALPPQQATQLALALGFSHGTGELARAQALIEQVLHAAEPAAQPWQPLARLVGLRLAEQRRLEEQIERLNQQGRDSQRRIDQLNEKLEALKAIERSLNARPVPPAKPSQP